MYSTRLHLVLGFHGCDRSVCDAVLNGQIEMSPSTNPYDWLGHGIYFWENNPQRALDYAKLLKQNAERARSTIHEPAVLGAVIALGHCLDLMEAKSLALLKSSWEILREGQSIDVIPRNRAMKGSNDLLWRERDCAVIEILHSLNRAFQNRSYDSVRGVFFEGEDLIPKCWI